jgi:hypothetical protein
MKDRCLAFSEKSFQLPKAPICHGLENPEAETLSKGGANTIEHGKRAANLLPLSIAVGKRRCASFDKIDVRLSFSTFQTL